MMFFKIKGEWYHANSKPQLDVTDASTNDAGGVVYYSAYWKQTDYIPSCFPKEVKSNPKCSFWEIEITTTDNAYPGCGVHVQLDYSKLQPCF